MLTKVQINERMPKTMQKKQGILLVFLLILTLSTLWFVKNRFLSTPIKPSPSPTQTVSSKITLITNNVKSNQIPVIVALKKGFFGKYNLEVDIADVQKNSIQALVSGQGDAIVLTPNIALAAAVEGAQLSWIGTVNDNNNWVVVSTKNPNSIKSMGVLSGLDKINSLGLLQLLGANPTNVQFQELADTQSKFLALKEKQIDSVGAAKTDWLLFRKKFNLPDEYRIILDSSVTKEAAQPVVIVVSNKFLKNKTAAESLTKALIEADYWIKNKDNQEELIKLFSEYYPVMSIDDATIYIEVYLSSLSGLNPSPDIKKGDDILKLITNINPKAKDYGINNFINTSIVDSLKSSGFLNQFNLN